MPLRTVDGLRDIEVRHEGDAESVVEGDLPVIDAIALRKRLIPRKSALRERGRLGS